MEELQCKTFDSSDASGQDHEINGWLETHPKVNIRNMTTTAQHDGSGSYQRIITTILFVEHED